jgi:hypothetical protein
MSAVADWLEDEWIKYAFTTTAMGTRPTEWHVALHTGAPGDDGAANEVSGSSYARVSTTWTQVDNTVSNAAAVTFPTVTSAGYTVTHFSVWDDDTAGNCLYVGPLVLSKALAVGEAGNFAIGELILSVD